MKKHKIAGLALSVLMAFGAVVPAAAEDTPITVYVNGQQVQFDVQPQLINDRTMVPFRFIFEALGAEVTYAGETQTITANLDNPARTITLQIGSVDATLEKGGEAYAFKSDVAPILAEGDRTLVPVRFIAEALDNAVCWNGDKKQVNIIDYQELASTLAQKAPLYSERFMETVLSEYAGSYTVSGQTSMTGAESEVTQATLTGDGTAVSIATAGGQTLLYNGTHLYAAVDGFSDAVQQIVSPTGAVGYIKADSDVADKFFAVTGGITLPVSVQQSLNTGLTPVLTANEAQVDNTTYSLLKSAVENIGALFADANIQTSEEGTTTTYRLEISQDALRGAIAAAVGASADQMGNVTGTISMEKVVNNGVLQSRTATASIQIGDASLSAEQSITQDSAEAAAVDIPGDDACTAFATVFPLLSVVQ